MPPGQGLGLRRDFSGGLRHRLNYAAPSGAIRHRIVRRATKMPAAFAASVSAMFGMITILATVSCWSGTEKKIRNALSFLRVCLRRLGRQFHFDEKGGGLVFAGRRRG